MTVRDALIAKVRAQGLPDGEGPLPVVSVEEFFTGNDDMGSIGCNLVDHPGVDSFYRLLREIRARPDVQDVLVGIYEVEEGDPSMWPFSERVYVLTSASVDEIRELLAPLDPDEVFEGWMGDKPSAAPSVAEPNKVVTAWWD